MLLNLRSDYFILQALQNGFALLYRQSHIRRRDLARALNHRNLVLNGFTSIHLSYQLYCPFHPSSLRHPTTLHALVRWGVARRIVWAWILTIPASAIVAALLFWAFRLVKPDA
jgi:phosphate/sulfate permease